MNSFVNICTIINPCHANLPWCSILPASTMGRKKSIDAVFCSIRRLLHRFWGPTILRHPIARTKLWQEQVLHLVSAPSTWHTWTCLPKGKLFPTTILMHSLFFDDNRCILLWYPVTLEILGFSMAHYFKGKLSVMAPCTALLLWAVYCGPANFPSFGMPQPLLKG